MAFLPISPSPCLLPSKQILILWWLDTPVLHILWLIWYWAVSCSTSSGQHKATHILLQSRPRDSFLGQTVWGVLRCVSGLSGISAGKESACNAGDPGAIPGLGRSPGEGKGYPFQYCGLENSMEVGITEWSDPQLCSCLLERASPSSSLSPLPLPSPGESGNWEPAHPEGWGLEKQSSQLLLWEKDLWAERSPWLDWSGSVGQEKSFLRW